MSCVGSRAAHKSIINTLNQRERLGEVLVKKRVNIMNFKCKICDDTGFKDYALFRSEPCYHINPVQLKDSLNLLDLSLVVMRNFTDTDLETYKTKCDAYFKTYDEYYTVVLVRAARAYLERYDE